MDRIQLPPPAGDPTTQLEEALIEEYLRACGHDRRSVHALPGDEARPLSAEASRQASTRLSEVEARAHYVHELQGRP